MSALNMDELRANAARHMLCLYRYHLVRSGWDVGNVADWHVTKNTTTSGWSASGTINSIAAHHSGAPHPVTAVENLIGGLDAALSRWTKAQRPTPTGGDTP